MPKSTQNKKAPRPRLASKPSSSSIAASPSVSAVYAAGESSLPSTDKKPRPSSVANNNAVSNPGDRKPSVTPSVKSRAGSIRSGDPAASSSAGNRTSWFRKGTWPRAGTKSLPIAQVAQENVPGESLASANAATDEPLSDPKPELPQEASDPVPNEGAEMPKITQTSCTEELLDESQATLTENQNVEEGAKNGAVAKDDKDGEAKVEEHPRSSWIGWWYGQPQPQPAQPSIETTPDTAMKPEEVKAEDAKRQEEPVKEPAKEPEDLKQEDSKPADAPQEPIAPAPGSETVKNTDRGNKSRGWGLGLWGYGYYPEAGTDQLKEAAKDVEVVAEVQHEPEPEPVVVEEPAQPEEPTSPTGTVGTTRSTTWSAWLRGSGAQNTETASLSSKNVPESESAEESKSKMSKVSGLKDGIIASSSDLNLPPSMETLKTITRTSTPKSLQQAPPTPVMSNPDANNSTASLPTRLPTADTTGTAKKKLQKMLEPPKNHVFPSFDSCYKPQPQVSGLLTHVQRMFRKSAPRPKSHLYLVNHPPHPKKAIAIGVHGFFPMKIVRSVLGEPTGTSKLFAKHASDSIKRWGQARGYEVEIEEVALEGEGKVGDRVNLLWTRLQYWIEKIKTADFVFMAAHSQGVVVGMQLLARMIEQGVVDHARVGFTAMAGINCGPFGHLPTTLLTGSARELFEFQKHDTAVSQAYVRSLRTVIAHNVRILYVGSIDDQLVPMESSTFSSIFHPYIYRAVFVNGKLHTPDFLSHLVGFTLKLRNLGISDHGLMRELSSPLAGSLYGGEGHSRIYDDQIVYDLGVRHALETSECSDVALKVDRFELNQSPNPFVLPWAVRGVLEEPLVRNELAEECIQLVKQFEEWRPTSKALKDVKFRLEAIKSKL